jgi:hypothetical protein
MERKSIFDVTESSPKRIFFMQMDLIDILSVLIYDSY